MYGLYGNTSYHRIRMIIVFRSTARPVIYPDYYYGGIAPNRRRMRALAWTDVRKARVYCDLQWRKKVIGRIRSQGLTNEYWRLFFFPVLTGLNPKGRELIVQMDPENGGRMITYPGWNDA